MSTNETPPTSPAPQDDATALPGPLAGAAPGKSLSPAAQRALAEAAERREHIDRRVADLARNKEVLGRGGLEPVRYEDWEVKGLTSDF
ncbi:DUF1674 domain-containing protein [Microvirga flavescens]|uniref:DUF1674 domain-containing protein n=1 Tax=Microvirga flavescens TaxID=2249811 RepID=UPI000DDBAFBE|nr:DUF1674 domain-containing protein [Microvirga flavescens]